MDKSFLDIIDKMQGSEILILGDMIADIYLEGTISRISREAPVLVLEQASEKVVAGGAANVVNNAATLGGVVHAAGLLGDDNGADGLESILAARSVDTKGFIRDKDRPTISKTRVIAGGRTTVSQQVVRIDKESKAPMKPEYEAEIGKYLDEVLPRVKGVVLSDYGSGTITEGLKNQILGYSQKNGIPVIVDSRYDIWRFKSVDYIKQNDAELAAAVGRELDSEADLVAAGKELLSKMSAKGVLITRGEDGMTLFGADGSVNNIPVSDKSEVFDVSGAGDTCVATVMLALAAGVEPLAAATLSNIASGIAVRKMGTSTVSAQELRDYITRNM
ncbi:PfkB family carbohydrate kinase [Anaerovibrio sp.]|uniref:bifunctional heptose 7-phosphate kinase/heptose 1-phosphate adenyltransferase n=1 Tax=Anaerovibrio sp. TaxID=1872532 RepID=UPI0025C43493|nr:PfkB family carbohydrate kinase [Anaerovibrio sp.]MBR2143371.1 carbohydrate kinase [Anaerovibrio sp.]